MNATRFRVRVACIAAGAITGAVGGTALAYRATEPAVHLDPHPACATLVNGTAAEVPCSSLPR